MLSKPIINNSHTVEVVAAGIYLKEKKDYYLIFNDHFKAVVDKYTGLISQYERNDKQVITDGVKFNFWRALTDNDKGWKVHEKMRVWKDEGVNYRLKRIKVDSISNKVITVESQYLFKETQSLATLKQTFYPDGTIQFDVDIQIPESAPNLPRIGLQFKLNKDLKNIEWYGSGPHENYVDRKTSAAVGIYKSNVNQWVTPYVKPQENANRSNIRWIKLGAGVSNTIEFITNSEEFLSVSAWPYSQETLGMAAHNFELSEGDELTVNIDHKQMGVGGDNSWGLPVMDKYQIKSGNYSYSFILQGSK